MFLSGVDPELRQQYREAGRVDVGEAIEVFEATPILDESSLQALTRATEWLAEPHRDEEPS